MSSKKFWIARDLYNTLWLYVGKKPERDVDIFLGNKYCHIDKNLYPEITWENSPQRFSLEDTSFSFRTGGKVIGKDMAWLAVDKDGTEWISSEELIRGPEIEKQDKRIKKRVQIISEDLQFYWAWPYSCHENLGERVMLPPGTIKKILGRDLKWEDGCIELSNGY